MDKTEKEQSDLRSAYCQGYYSYPKMIVANNPYPVGSKLYDEWALGRSEAKRAIYDEQFEGEDE